MGKAGSHLLADFANWDQLIVHGDSAEIMGLEATDYRSEDGRFLLPRRGVTILNSFPASSSEREVRNGSKKLESPPTSLSEQQDAILFFFNFCKCCRTASSQAELEFDNF
jgi:hypothetical protein